MDGQTNLLRRAPLGFTFSEWEEFDARGLLIRDDAFSATELDGWLDAVQRVESSRGKAVDDFFTLRNFVEADAGFADLIDHPRLCRTCFGPTWEILRWCRQPSSTIFRWLRYRRVS
jgi:hypothetical protein